MRIICVFRQRQDYSRFVNEWLENFYRRTGQKIETMDPDKNVNFCETYEIIEYPTIIAIDDSGRVRAFWHGKSLPLINEVSYYLQ